MVVNFSLLEHDVLVARLTEPQIRLGGHELAELADAVRRVENDTSASGLVITGSGDAYFCSGGPGTASLSANADFVQEHGVGFPPHLKPIVAAVNGDALGGGLALALSCDGVVATREATLGSSLVAGFASDDEMALGSLLTARLGSQRAAELLYTGKRLTCHEARQEGIVDVCVNDVGDLLSTALTTLRRLG